MFGCRDTAEGVKRSPSHSTNKALLKITTLFGRTTSSSLGPCQGQVTKHILFCSTQFESVLRTGKRLRSGIAKYSISHV